MADRLRIALLYLGRQGGIANYSVDLARGLQDKCDLVCYFSANCWVRPKMEKLSCPVHFYPTYQGWPSYIYATLRGDSVQAISKAIKAQAPDFVIDTASGPWGESLYRRRTPELSQWARMIHDVISHEGSNLSWKAHRVLFRFAADIMLAPSDFSARQLEHFYPGQKIVATRLGVNFAGDPPDLDSVVANRKNLLFFGRIQKYKGVDILVEAYAQARSIDPELRLVIAGKGKLAPPLKARIAELGIILMNDFIPDGKITELVAAAGILVLPYISATQSGVSATGLANGLPMIATDVGGLSEHVIDGRNGRLVPAGDSDRLAAAMIEISQSAQLARSMAEQSLELGRTIFEWNGIARDLLADLYRLRRPKSTNSKDRIKS